MMLYMIIFACFACLVLGSPEKNPLMAKRKRLVLVAVSILAAKYYDTHYRKTPYHDSKLSGDDYYCGAAIIIRLIFYFAQGCYYTRSTSSE